MMKGTDMQKSHIRRVLAPGFGLLLTATLLVAQATEPDADVGGKASLLRKPLGKEVRKVSTNAVSLAPGAQMDIKVPLWNAGTIVTARFDPTNQASVSGPSKDTETRVSFVVKVNGKSLNPKRGAGNRLFELKVNDYAETGTAILKNLGSQPIHGKLTIIATDSVEKGKADAIRRAKDVAVRSEQTQHADLLLAYNHILKRHLSGYPGGKSELEQRVSRAIAKAGAKKETVVALSQATAAMQPHLEAKARHSDLISRPIRLSIQTADIKRLLRDDVAPSPPTEIRPAKYGIELVGIRSHRCGDDFGWEAGCDIEEPYVIWSAFGPNYVRAGVTEDGETAGKGSEYLYRTNTHVLSTGPNSMTPVDIDFPLTFIYQVIENDPEGPTKDQLFNALKVGIAAGLEIYGKDYTNGFPHAVDFFKDVVDIAGRAFGGGDDRYPSMGIVLDGQRMFQYTSGQSPGPRDESFFDRPGNYDHLGIRAPVVSIGGNKHWTLLYVIRRTDKS